MSFGLTSDTPSKNSPRLLLLLPLPNENGVERERGMAGSVEPLVGEDACDRDLSTLVGLTRPESLVGLTRPVSLTGPEG